MKWGNFQSLRMSLPTTAILATVVVAIFLGTMISGSTLLGQFVTRMYIYMVLVVGLQVFMGNTNILWFPHVGFMGIGAYVSAICSMPPFQKAISLTHLYPVLGNLHLTFIPALMVGALVAAAI